MGPLEEYETIVFDLDGTLVRLEVEWDTVTAEVGAVLEARGIDPPDTLWGMLEAADERGHRPAVEDVISAHERDGAAASTRLPAADTVPDGAVGLCSLNCEAACRIALSTHGIEGIDAVVGRDTVPTEKPDPQPLLETIDRLGGDPAAAVFVGDTDRDARTAKRAGVDYLDVSSWLRAYR